MAICKDCEAPVTWASTASGKNIMLDEQPSKTGRYVCVKGKATLATEQDRRLLRPLYTCHWDHCKPGGC